MFLRPDLQFTFKLKHYLMAFICFLTCSGFAMAGIFVFYLSEIKSQSSELAAASGGLFWASSLRQNLQEFENFFEFPHGPKANDLEREFRNQMRNGLQAVPKNTKSADQQNLMHRITDKLQRLMISMAILREQGRKSAKNAAESLHISNEFRDVQHDLLQLIFLNEFQQKESIRKISELQVAATTTAKIVFGLIVLLGIAFFALTNRVVLQPFFILREAIPRIGDKSFAADYSALLLQDFREILASFNQKNKALAEAERQRYLVMAGVAHDLKTPLAAAIMAAQMLSQSMPGASGAQKSRFAVLIRQLKYLENLSNDLLFAAKSETEQIEFHPQWVSLNAIIENSRLLFESQARGANLVFNPPNQNHYCYIDDQRLTQVINNLLSNAIKYSSADSTIFIYLWKTTTAICISIKDNGVGISEEDLTQIFTPFRRTKTTEKAFPGVGIGLYLARKIIRAQGGELIAKSNGPGSGAEFIIRLPIELCADKNQTSVPLTT